MRVIGITGGVGAGKSAILSYLEETYHAKIILADNVANEIKEPGQACYEKIVALLGENILMEADTLGKRAIDRAKMAAVIFKDKETLKKVNAVIHPAVKEEIVRRIENAKKSGQYPVCFVEAALLIEDHYDTIVEEMWLIDTDPKVRRARLKENRGYSNEKIDAIMKQQLSREEYQKHCKEWIDNNGTVEQAYRQIDTIMKRLNERKTD